MVGRRDFLKAAGSMMVAFPSVPQNRSVLLNDVQSRLNPTWVEGVHRPDSLESLQAALRRARREEKPVSVAGGRHSMGGQQFGGGTVHVDMRGLARVLSFDRVHGRIEVEAGIQWPELIAFLHSAQADAQRPWAIAQKQTGADRLTIGGALASNVHGRGLAMRPFVQDIESFTLIGSDGAVRPCSRTENPELFALAVGGYGLFGLVYSVELRLVPRRKLERVVEIADAGEVAELFEQRRADGFTYGDFQYCTNERAAEFMREGVFSCYRPVDDDAPMSTPRVLSDGQWNELYYLAHTDKTRAYKYYCDHYLSTSGQVYWSDVSQLSADFEAAREVNASRLDQEHATSLVISELYVPREELAGFLAEAREDFLEHGVDVIYGTVRLIEQDNETFLAWAKRPYACVIFNLRATHTPAGLGHAAESFRRLIDMAARRGGSYYPTYHKFAKRKQVEACYPQMAEFLRLKRRHDPEERWQSDWYRHYRRMFAETA